LDRRNETRTQKSNAITFQLLPLPSDPSISMNREVQMIKSISITTLCVSDMNCEYKSRTKDTEQQDGMTKEGSKQN
jgi:hypothetical protein